MEEIWKDVPDYPGYQASTSGALRSFWDNQHRITATSHLIKGHPDKDGYVAVHLHKNAQSKNARLHRLIAETFIPNPDNKPQVNHKNGIKNDNRVENLEWATLSENRQHAYDTGLQHPHGEQPIRIVETGEVFKSISDCARHINGFESGIRHCLYGDRNTHKDLHFEYVDKEKYEMNKQAKQTTFLYDYQFDAVMKLRNGNILCGGVGSGKSRSGLFYYFKENGGWIDKDGYTPMKDPQDLYIITTAKKRDSLEWLAELAPYLLSTNPEENHYKNKVVVDSWNNIGKYVDVRDAFFLLDEQRVVGTGAWTKAFLKIAKVNDWILLTATPGDTYMDYLPVFLANGFFKNKTEFTREHVVYSRYAKFPMIERYTNTYRLDRLRNRVLVQMDYKHAINTHHEDVYCDYDILTYKDVMRRRWDVFKDEPIQQASGLCYVLRKVVNSDPSRGEAVLDIVKKKRKVIIFYSFDYELEILRNLPYGDHVKLGELNGHKHQEVPEGSDWVYLVNYAAGAEAWQNTRTDAMIFYSQTYSYKVLTQAAGRIDRLNTPYTDLYYYHLKSRSSIDIAISKALKAKKKFNEIKFVKW